MAVSAIPFGITAQPPPPQLLTLARHRFLAVVRGGLPDESELPVTEVPLSALEGANGEAVPAQLRDDGECFLEAERTIITAPLRDFIGQLSLEERELVQLIFWTELSQAEVARRRGWHPMKVHRQLESVLSRARVHLAPHRHDLLAA